MNMTRVKKLLLLQNQVLEDDFVSQCEGLCVKHVNIATVGAKQQLTGVRHQKVTGDHL